MVEWPSTSSTTCLDDRGTALRHSHGQLVCVSVHTEMNGEKLLNFVISCIIGLTLKWIC